MRVADDNTDALASQAAKFYALKKDEEDLEGEYSVKLEEGAEITWHFEYDPVCIVCTIEPF